MKYLPFTAILFSFSVHAQSDSTKLPKPTGTLVVGTVTYEWTDVTRKISYSSFSSDNRKIITQFWYPVLADSNAKQAPYNALSKDYKHVQTYSILSPAFANTVSKAPLIIFCPGRGVERFGYTALAEELASHGYVVASIDMPEIGYVYYQDGLTLTPSNKYRAPRGLMAGPYEKVDEFYEEANQTGTRDVLFVLQNIMTLSKNDPSGRFTDKIDMSNIGLFGHSLGGRISGNVAVKNKGIKALVTMEGIPPRDVRYKGLLRIPCAMWVSSSTLPFAKVNYQVLIDNRKTQVDLVELKKFGHNSVTDFPLVTPSQFKYEIDPSQGLRILRELMLNFFNSTLRHSKTVYSLSTNDVIITSHQ